MEGAMKQSIVTALLGVACLGGVASEARAQAAVDPAHAFCWGENAGWVNWGSSPPSAVSVTIAPSYLSGFVWSENFGWISLGNAPQNGIAYLNVAGDDFGVNLNRDTGELSGFAWCENAGWINFGGGALASPARPARIDMGGGRLAGYAWGENLGWLNLDDQAVYVGVAALCGTSDYNGDGDIGTDADIEAFFACLGGNCCASCASIDFNADGDIGTDADIESFFRVLGGSAC
jgi:hypothetical protein